MANQIKEVREKLDKVVADGTKFGLASVDPRLDMQGREMMYPDADASSVIGRQIEKDEIINADASSIIGRQIGKDEIIKLLM